MHAKLSVNKSTNGRSCYADGAGTKGGGQRAESEARAAQEIARVRGLLRVLDYVSPRLSARAAEPLFLTPRRFRRPSEEQRAWAEAERMHWKIGGHRIPVYAWGHGPVVLFAHCWEGRGTQAAPFVQPLVARGFRVLSWDQPGHGDADAARVTVLDFAQVTEGIARRVGEVHAVIGHSLGGTATIYARARHPFARRIVTIASPLHPRQVLAEFGRLLALSEPALEGLKERLGARHRVHFESLDLRLVTPQLAIEGLVVHDRADREVPFEHGLELFRNWPGAELFTTEGLGHRRILKAPEVIAKVVDAITETEKAPSWEELISAELYQPAARCFASADGISEAY